MSSDFNKQSTVSICTIMSVVLAWAVEVAVLEGKTGRDKHEVEEEHGEAKTSVHLPPKAGDAEDDKKQHHKEKDDTAHHALGIDQDWLAVDYPIKQPGKGQPEMR